MGLMGVWDFCSLRFYSVPLGGRRGGFGSFLRGSGGFQLLDALYLPGGEALALGLEALDGDELLGVDLF